MQAPPLIKCRAPPLLALRMLSSCSDSGIPSSTKASSYKLPIGLHAFPSRLIPRPYQDNSTRSLSVTSNSHPFPSISEWESEELETNESPTQSLVVVSFYKFTDFPDHADLRKPLKDLCEELRVSGGIILAPEGINGSICGTRQSVERVIGFIESDSRLSGLRRLESPVSAEEEALHHGHTASSPLGAGEDAPFRWDHVRIKLKKEIVSLGMPAVSPIERVGKYVSPRDWNELISDPHTSEKRNLEESPYTTFPPSHHEGMHFLHQAV